MSDNPVTPRLRPEPSDVRLFADTVVQLRYRIVLNYLNAESADTEAEDWVWTAPLPKVVRDLFKKLLDVTVSINRGRAEDRKLEGHIVAVRKLVERFEREWFSDDHKSRLKGWKRARKALNELTGDDWADIRRDAPADSDVFSAARIDAESLRDSPFTTYVWAEYEAAVQRYVDTFDLPCRTLYRLVRALAAVCYPDPATYDGTLGTFLVYDDEHLIKHVFPQVQDMLAEIQAQTCFNLNVGKWFDAANAYGSTTVFSGKVGEILDGWDGEVPVVPGLDRPRWEPASPGAKYAGLLSFRGTSTRVGNQAKVIALVLKAFEDGAWQLPVPFPPGKLRGAVLQSLNDCVRKGELPMTFSSEKQGNQYVCRWHATEETGGLAGAPTAG